MAEDKDHHYAKANLKSGKLYQHKLTLGASWYQGNGWLPLPEPLLCPFAVRILGPLVEKHN